MRDISQRKDIKARNYMLMIYIIRLFNLYKVCLTTRLFHLIICDKFNGKEIII